MLVGTQRETGMRSRLVLLSPSVALYLPVAHILGGIYQAPTGKTPNHQDENTGGFEAERATP